MFENLFDSDNALWRTLNIVADIMILNVIFFVCCLPIVTIGASTTALYTVILRMVEKGESHIVKSFFKAFKSNFKQSTLIWLIMLVVGALLAGDWYLAKTMELSFASILQYIFIFLAFCFFMILCYVFPLQSKFENKVLTTITNSAMMGIAHFLPWTLLIMLVNMVPLFVLYISVDLIIYLIPVMFLFGFATMAYVNSKMFRRIFARHMPADTEEAPVESAEE